ncbi:MAG: energy transducer TonB [Pedobacter sp.]
MRRLLLITLVLAGVQLKAQPSLKGGLESFVQNNRVYPRYSLTNCIQGVVNIAFKLDRKGSINYSEIRKGVGTDLDDEALRLIRMSSGRWIVPADHDSTIAIIVPISFSLTDCSGKSAQDVRAAIDAYQSNTDLTNSILNYYRNKELGKPGGITEAKAAELKADLGIDEDYLRKRLADGLKKIKQKDNQGACEDFKFVKYMGSELANESLAKYCR